MTDTGAQTTYDESPPMTDSELDEYLWSLQNSLGVIGKKREWLDEEEQGICALIRETRNEICRREWQEKEIV